jgi:hypothetical protein
MTLANVECGRSKTQGEASNRLARKMSSSRALQLVVRMTRASTPVSPDWPIVAHIGRLMFTPT